MTQTLAIANARQLRTHLLARGVKTVSIELVEGRGGSGWLKLTHVGSMGHHTVSRRSNGNTPCLKLVKVGRPDVVGPLCNGYGGFDEVARIICMGWANHPGAGGPLRVEAGTVPVNNGRPYFFGWEFEGGLVEADFTPSYRRFMASCLAGTLDFLHRSDASHAEHKTWAPGRKVDRLGYTLDKARQEIADKVSEDSMSFTPEEIAALKALAPYASFLSEFGKEMLKPGSTTGMGATPQSLMHVLEVHRLIAEDAKVSGTDHKAIAARLLGG